MPREPSIVQALVASIQVQVRKADSTLLYKGYLHEDCIILADPGRPFARTDKLTVKRRETPALYEEDIEEKFFCSRQPVTSPVL